MKKDKRTPVGILAPAPRDPMVSVGCRLSDWKALVHFVRGDLQNIPEDDAVRRQMERVLDRINTRLV